MVDVVEVKIDEVVQMAHRDRKQKAKTAVRRLATDGASENKARRKIYSPWVIYDGITEDDRWQVKTIVLRDNAMLEKNGIEELVDENQSTQIPLDSNDPLSNPGNIPAEISKVQSGFYLGEDAIARFEDRYGRNKPAVCGVAA